MTTMTYYELKEAMYRLKKAMEEEKEDFEYCCECGEVVTDGCQCWNDE